MEEIVLARSRPSLPLSPSSIAPVTVTEAGVLFLLLPSWKCLSSSESALVRTEGWAGHLVGGWLWKK